METSLASPKQTKKWWPAKFSAIKSSSITPVFFKYNTITLKLFLDIAQTNDYKKILVSGDASVDVCEEHWEKIVEQHNYHSGNYDHLNYLSHVLAYLNLFRKYNTVRENLTLLLLVIDMPAIEYLRKEGYSIVMNKGQEAYEKSIAAAFNKSNNLNSKLKQKMNQINTFNEALIASRRAFNQNEEGTGFEERIATISYHLHFAIDQDITLALYNQYVKKINKENSNGTGKERHHHG
jgi:hypothetical protein